MITVRNLTYVYRGGKGVFDLDFAIAEGEVFGYLGPNGAGKTTTIRHLLGFMNASAGTATIDGLDCRRDAAELQNRIGYLPGEIAFLENMTGTEFLRFIADMRRTSDRRRCDDLIERFALDAGQKIRRMSKGMKQKLAVVTAFMHDPAVYILDEPTSGLDPFMQNEFIDLLRSEKARGKTILMSSHLFDEVQRVCDRVGIIKDGRIVAIEDIQSLNAARERSYTVTLADAAEADAVMQSGLDVERVSDNRVNLTVRNNYHDVFTALAARSVIGLESRAQSLESIFMKYYGAQGDTQ